MGVKKAEKDATRAERKAKRRKAENAIPDLPGDSEIHEQNTEKISKKRKRLDNHEPIDDPKPEKKARKHEKKARKNTTEPGALVGDADEQVGSSLKNYTVVTTVDHELPKDEHVVDITSEPPKKSKKERKAERKVAEAAAAAAASTTGTDETTTQQEPKESTSQPQDDSAQPVKSKKNNRNREKKRQAASIVAGNAEDPDKTNKKAARFIVFIGKFEAEEPRELCLTNFFSGNLPFTANTASIEKHFEAVKPKSVRHLTQKDDLSKSKGCAFVEFDGYDHMKTCLKQFHHSTFDDGLSAPRKINVELT